MAAAGEDALSAALARATELGATVALPSTTSADQIGMLVRRLALRAA